mgnify:CR=1 FL=1
MIPERIQQLIQQAEQSKEAEEFWQEVNELAEKHQVTCDYILAEFY